MNEPPRPRFERYDSAAPSTGPGTPESMEDDLLGLDQHLISLHGSTGQGDGTSPANSRVQDPSVFSYNADTVSDITLALSLTLSHGPSKSFVTGRAYVLEPEPEQGMAQAQAQDQDQDHTKDSQSEMRSPSQDSIDVAAGVDTNSRDDASARYSYGTWKVIYERKFDELDTDMPTAEDLTTWVESLATDVLKQDSDVLASGGGIPLLSKEQKDHVLDLRDNLAMEMAEYALEKWSVFFEAEEGDEA